MSLFIEPEIIEKTVCDKNFGCLQADRKFLCKVEARLGDTFYMTCHHDESCPNQERLPGFIKCNCLVRKAIYLNYGI